MMRTDLRSKIRRSRLPFLSDAKAGRGTVTLLRAPIGFGKTSLLRQWYAEALSGKHRAGWITLSTADRSIDQLARSLAHQTSLLCRCGSPPSAYSLRSAFEEMDGYLLFLDEWDAIRGSESESLIADLLATGRSRIHLHIACRKVAALPIEFLLEQDRLRLIGKDALKFSDSEQRRLMGAKEWSGLPHSFLADFDGWPLAFSLLKASEHSADRTLPEPAVFARQSGLEEIVAGKLQAACGDEELKLLNVLGLGTDVDLATLQDVSGVLDAGELFDELTSLIPCQPYADGATMRFRFSPLLRPLLERRFDRLSATERRAIVDKAYERSIGQGRTLDAINFALLAGEAERAIGLMEAIGPFRLMMIYGIEPVQGLLSRMPLHLLPNAFRSRLAIPVIHAKRGCLVEAREMVETVVADIRASHLPAIFKRQAMRDAMFARIQIAACSDSEWVDAFEGGARLELAKEPAFAAWARVCSGVAHYQAGRLDAAEEHFLLSEAASRQFGATYQLIHLRLHCTLVELARGEVRSARRALRALSIDARAAYPNDLSLLAAIEIASIEASLLTSRTSVQPEALLAAIVKLRQSDGLYDLYAMALTNMARCLHTEDPEALFRWLDETEVEFCSRGITHVLGILRAIRAFYAAISGRFDDSEEALPRREFELTDDFAQTFWRERHLEGMARSLIASNLGHHDVARRISSGLVSECKRDGRRVALVEACLNHAEILLSISGETEEALSVLAFGLETAVELHAPGLLDEWRRLLEIHADSLAARLQPSAAELLEGSLRQWRGQVQPDLLSAREVSVLTCVANGLTNKHAARELMIGVDAVKFHLKRIFLKLQVHGRSEAVARARSAGLI